MTNAIFDFRRNEAGTTAIEHEMTAGMVALVLSAVFPPTGSMGVPLTDVFARIATALTATAC